MFLLYYIKLTGSLVMEHPGTHPLPIQGKPTIFGGVNGSIGMLAIIIQYRVLPKILANFITSCQWGKFHKFYNAKSCVEDMVTFVSLTNDCYSECF